MIVASVVLPRPGGPYRRTWSAASPLPRAACQQDGQVGLDLALADVLVERPRSERALDDAIRVVLDVRREDVREVVGHRLEVYHARRDIARMFTSRQSPTPRLGIRR